MPVCCSLGVKSKTYRFVLELMEQEPYKKELQLSHILILDRLKKNKLTQTV